MTRSLVVVLGLSLAGVELAEAQIIQGGLTPREPIVWTSLSIGWLRQGRICDADTSACWEFGGAPQWRGTFEFPMGRGASVGLAATTARVPLIYDGSLTGTNSCAGCDAHANVSQYFGNFRIGGGSGFHQVIDLNAGLTVFSNFRSVSGTRLGGPAISDFSFTVGYGFGYSLSPRAQIMLVQDFGLVIHKKPSSYAENTAQQTTLRIGARVGLGEGR